jgi:hypothetical protein
MKTFKTLALAGAAAIALAGAATADPHGPAAPINGQIQLGDVFSHMNVETSSANEAVSAAVSAGNAFTAVGLNKSVVGDSSQVLNGNVGAAASLSNGWVGTGIVSSVSYGNAATVQSCCGAVQGNYTQSAGGTGLNGLTPPSGNTVSATASANLEKVGKGLSVSSVAGTNVLGLSGQNSFYDITVDQRSVQSTTANTSVQVLEATGPVIATATSTVNNVSYEGYASTVDQLRVNQLSTGDTSRAVTDVFVSQGTDVLAASTANGNAITLHNTDGFARLDRTEGGFGQGNRSTINAETYVTLDNFSGVGSASAYGVGNTALVSNSNSGTLVDFSQTNTGNVNSFASLNGGYSTDGTAIVNSASIGNSFAGYGCSNCGGVQGSINQVNSGNITARGQITGQAVYGAVGTASAIGNSATYYATTPKTH